MIQRWLRLFSCLLPLAFAGAFPLPLVADESGDEGPAPPRVTVPLSHAEATVRLYEPDEQPPKAIVIFGSGDGGWSPWEDSVCQWLREAGVYAVGFDLREYAAKDYDAALLGKDMAALAADAAARCMAPDIPVVYAGWSMGAVQAVPAGAWKERPKTLKGLLLMSADSRGRFGLRTSDELGLTPTGPGTFGLVDFSAGMRGLRVAQFHGGADFMASTAWVQSLQTPRALYTVPGANHGFDGPADSFQEWVLRGLDWVLGDDSASAPPPHTVLPFGLSPLWPAAALAIVLAVFFIVSKRHSVLVLVSAVAVMGVVDLLEALSSKPLEVLAWMEQWVPLGISEKSRLLLFFSGIALLGLARGLARRKHVAWLLALVMLAISAVLHLTRAFDWHHTIAALVLLVPLVRWRKEFVARSDASSLRLAWRVAILLAAGLFIYGVFNLREFSERGEFGEALTWSDCASGSASALALQKSEYDRDGSRDVRTFLRTLRGGSLVSGIFVLVLMLRPVLERRFPDATEEERQRAKRITSEHGGDPMDAFALLEDKRYYFNEAGTGFVAYALWRKYAVALADPICAAGDRAGLVHGFTHFCVGQDWEPLFYCSHVQHRPLYEQEGFITFKVGEDARLDVNEFKLQGGRFQNLRTARNKAQKAGLTFQWYVAEPHPDHGLEAQLQLLSNDWLHNKHGGEMTFDLGAFSIPFIREHGAAIIRNPEGRMEAFATWHPYLQGKGRCLDIMRARAETRDVMDFLIVEAIDYFKALGVEEISLGNAPLANVEVVESEKLACRKERAVQFLFENFDRFYGYKSLFNFKKKYQPEWQGRYLAYRPGVSLAMVGLAIGGVHLPKGFIGLLRS